MLYLPNLTDLSRSALAATMNAANSPVFAVDATLGNGQDALFLAANVGPGGHVFAFDVQETALARARLRFANADPHLLGRVSFIQAGHETAQDVLPPKVHGNLRAVTFNLGFLPGSDRQIVTTAPTTLVALESLAGMLQVGGILSVHAYLGHPGGREEGEAVGQWATALSWKLWRVARYEIGNKERNQEVLFLAERA